MIHYSLHCADAHEFDGWFPSAAAFERQADSGQISCPTCGDTRITRALMAPALSRKSNSRPDASPPVAPPPVAPAPVAPAPVAHATPEPSPAPPLAAVPAAPAQPSAAGQVAMLPDALRVALQKLRAEVEKRAEYVGGAFADEARRIHEGDSAARPIYGEATDAEAQALAEDGIEVARIPWVPRADS